jgi:hypothetical protein
MGVTWIMDRSEVARQMGRVELVEMEQRPGVGLPPPWPGCGGYHGPLHVRELLSLDQTRLPLGDELVDGSPDRFRFGGKPSRVHGGPDVGTLDKGDSISPVTWG